jgi:hypothetical protein
MKFVLTLNQYLKQILVLNPEYDTYFNPEYLKFLQEILPNSKKTRSSKMFELDKKDNQISFIRNYNPVTLTSNEFLSNLIDINHKNPFQLVFLNQVLDYHFYGRIETQFPEIIEIKKDKIMDLEVPMSIKEIIETYYKIPLRVRKPNNRVKKYQNHFQNQYQNAKDIPISELHKFSQVFKVILGIKVYNTQGIYQVYQYLDSMTFYSDNVQNKCRRKNYKTKYKRTDNYNYELKASHINKLDNYTQRKNTRCPEPKWGYIHSFFPTSRNNRERKWRYYIDNQDRFLKKPHRNFLRYKKKYRIKKT